VYGRFTGELPAAEVERFFYRDDADRDLIARRRADHHRLGFAVQLGTVRAVGRFRDPLDVPWPAVEFRAEQLEIGNASCVKEYVQRPQTPYEHAWEIRDRYGYRSFDDPGCAGAFARFLEGRAWTHVEGPLALFTRQPAGGGGHDGEPPHRPRAADPGRDLHHDRRRHRGYPRPGRRPHRRPLPRPWHRVDALHLPRRPPFTCSWSALAWPGLACTGLPWLSGVSRLRTKDRICSLTRGLVWPVPAALTCYRPL
jgi:hypothetical protein